MSLSRQALLGHCSFIHSPAVCWALWSELREQDEEDVAPVF